MKDTIKITDVLKNSNFLKLCIGQIVSALGDRFHQMALLGIIMKNGGNVGEELSKITFWSILPFFIFSLFSGVLSDRWSRKKILIVADISRALLVCAIPWVIRDSTCITAAYPLIFIIGIFACLFSPAKFSIIPTIVEEGHLLAANSLLASSALLTVLAGTVIGGIVFDFMGFRLSLYFDAVTFLFSAGMLWMLKVKESKRLHFHGVHSFLTDVKMGAKSIYQDGRLMILIFFGSIFWFIGISFYVLVSDFAHKIWGITSVTPLGLFFTFLGGGLMSGAVLAGKYGNRIKRNLLYTSTIFVLALGIISFSFVKSYIAASGIVFFVGIAGGAFLAPVSADIQLIVPDELRGRTFAIKEIFVNAGMVTPALIVGRLTTFTSVRELILYLGIGVFTTGIFVAWKSMRLNTIPHHTQN